MARKLPVKGRSLSIGDKLRLEWQHLAAASVSITPLGFVLCYTGHHGLARA